VSELIGLKGKVCIITGAGKGIGYACAKAFAAEGARLAVISRSKDDLERLSQDLALSESDFYMMSGDVSDGVIVSEFIANVIAKYGVIDVLVNNAGIRFRKKFLEISYEEWQHVMNVNAGSTFLFCKEVGQHMVARNSGKIINMASIIGTLGLPELVGYGASKGAIISLTKSLSLEWAENNINVNVIAPGFCETSYADNFKEQSDLYQFTIDRTPMKKWGSSSDIANACIYLASDMSKYVTGEVLSVDGGWSSW
jgi:NAD(P)-dependent dehydrogenase (short-subunit alcohol dehydrogenase family)